MSIKDYVGKHPVQRLGTLLNMGAVILGMTAPALSQLSGQMPPTIVPNQPSGQTPPTIVPNQPTTGQPQTIGQPQFTPVSPNLNQLVTQWGFTSVTCRVGVATIRLDTNTVCVNPTPQLSPGDYVYDPASNQIKPFQVTAAFTFKNVTEYGNCLEDILRLYEDKEKFRQQPRRSDCSADVFRNSLENGLSKAQSLAMIEAANFYATSLLNPKLFPPRGQRVRIAQMFGFIYEIDAKDEAIQKLATQGATENTSR